MRIDISLLPALAAAFMLVFARIGAMVMLLPGLGESNIPVRIKLAIAVLLTLIILPLHRAAYQIDMNSLTPLLVLMVHEIVIGVVLGATARVTLAALQVAGSVIAQQMGLGFVTAVDPTQNQQGLLVGNFLTVLGVALVFATDLHHLAIAAMNGLCLRAFQSNLDASAAAEQLQRRWGTLSCQAALLPAVMPRRCTGSLPSWP